VDVAQSTVGPGILVGDHVEGRPVTNGGPGDFVTGGGVCVFITAGPVCVCVCVDSMIL
jgi:hypothetical protein